MSDAGRPFREFLDRVRPEVDAALDRVLPAVEPTPADPCAPDPGGPGRTARAMRWAVEGGGKRVRPGLMLAVADDLGAARAARGRVLWAGVAVELVHTGSLVLDDLPALDDADLRRGRASVHVRFGEAVGVLAGTALLNLAFGVPAEAELPPGLCRLVTGELSRAVGVDGMIGGEEADLHLADDTAGAPGLEDLERAHRLKTGALFEGALRIAAALCDADGERTRALTDYGRNLGLAYQIVDDLLDVEGDPEALGKPVGADAGGTSFLQVASPEEARALAAELTEYADRALAPLGDAPLLRSAAAMLTNRAS